jgi:hypothetical protein
MTYHGQFTESVKDLVLGEAGIVQVAHRLVTFVQLSHTASELPKMGYVQLRGR